MTAKKVISMHNCIRVLHHEMESNQLIKIILTDDKELTIRKSEKVTKTGNLIIIIRKDGRKVVINPDHILYFFTKGAEYEF